MNNDSKPPDLSGTDILWTIGICVVFMSVVLMLGSCSDLRHRVRMLEQQASEAAKGTEEPATDFHGKARMGKEGAKPNDLPRTLA